MAFSIQFHALEGKDLRGCHAESINYQGAGGEIVVLSFDKQGVLLNIQIV